MSVQIYKIFLDIYFVYTIIMYRLQLHDTKIFSMKNVTMHNSTKKKRNKKNVWLAPFYRVRPATQSHTLAYEFIDASLTFLFRSLFLDCLDTVTYGVTAGKRIVKGKNVLSTKKCFSGVFYIIDFGYKNLVVNTAICE